MNDTAPLVLDIVSYNDDDTSSVIGQLTLNADGVLAVQQSEPGAQARLAELVELTNNKPGLHMDVPPPEGSPRFAVASRFVQRGDPDFLAALQDYVDKYYGWALEQT